MDENTPVVRIITETEQYGERMIENLKRELDAQKRGEGKTKIYQHQIEAVLALKDYFDTNGTEQFGLIVAPTGSGKTEIMSLIPYVLVSHQTLFLTPTPVLSRQLKFSVCAPVNPNTFLEIIQWFPKHFTVKDKNKYLPSSTLIERTKEIDYTRANIVIINAQKLGGNSNYSLQKLDQLREAKQNQIESFFESFDLLVDDEAHHYGAPLWLTTVEVFKKYQPNGRIVFLSATPYRMMKGDRIRILSVECEVYTMTRSDLGELQDPHYGGDIYFIFWRKAVVVDILRELYQHDAKEARFKHKAIVLVSGVTNAHIVAKEMNGQEPNSATITGDHLNAEKEIMEFKSGKFRVAVVCRMLTEGFDHPAVSICVVYREIRPQLLFEQFLGRCMRKFKFPDNNQDEDKTTALVLTYKRFGQQDRFDQLQQGEVVSDTLESDDGAEDDDANENEN